ncbi:pullulanase-type alpha-1,6-glucosidase [Georgenia sp. Z1344]|uniref:pullulanase-type alpha-1,6-glucosidase n=1 Tax=Georgenia sp. Z1344 TaxID=3416706 RepID=UPI003CF77697
MSVTRPRPVTSTLAVLSAVALLGSGLAAGGTLAAATSAGAVQASPAAGTALPAAPSPAAPLPAPDTPAVPAPDASDRQVVLAGDLQTELGCAADWDTACAETTLTGTDVEGVYELTAEVPAGTWQFKAALDGVWDGAIGDGEDNYSITLAAPTTVTFRVDDAAGTLAIDLPDLPGEYDESTDDALVAEPYRDAGAGESFYFVLTDRFENGDPSNDTGGIAGDRLDHGFDPTNRGFYQGGDIAGLSEQLDYIEGLGTTAIWLTPSFVNRPVQGEGEDASAGYHGYWITDFTQIDPHLGTNAELEAFIDDAHARGIDVYFDIITNHTADNFSFAEGEYAYRDIATYPYTDAAGTAVDVSALAGSPDFPELDPATSFPYTPVRNDGAVDMVPELFNDPTVYHHRGSSTWEGESVTFGDFENLDDVMTEDPRVVAEFIDIYTTWMDLGIDGFRIDTVKHVNVEFWEEFTAALDLHAEATNPDFFTFGEVFDADATLTSPYVRDTDMTSVLDFAYQSSALNYASGYTAQGLAGLFASDDYYTTPHSTSTSLPTFLGNHDMGRVGYLLQGRGDELARSELGHSLMYLTRGQPVVYYGDEQGFVGTGNDKGARQSLFASRTAEYTDQTLLTGEQVGSRDLFDTGAPLYTHIAELAQLREDHPALVTGAQVELYAESGGGVYAFSRVDRADPVEHLVAVNNLTTPQTVTLDTLSRDATYTPILGDGAALTADGAQVTIEVPPLTALAWVADTTVAPVGDGTLEMFPGGTELAGSGNTPTLAPISADVPDNHYLETSFAYRVAGETDWQPLGVAEDDTPRVFHDVEGLAAGTVVEYRAVATDADGASFAGSTFGVVGYDLSGTPADDGPGDGEIVTVPGSHQAAMGCPGDWQPGCADSALTLDEASGLYVGTFDLPAGDYEYKIAIGDSWDVNYGAGGVPGGDNVSYSHDGGEITFVYDPATHLFTSTAEGPLVTLPGSFQPALGCGSDWAPDCLASLMWDADGDGVYTFTTTEIPVGSHEVKAAHGRSWAENYGVGGELDGANYPFVVSSDGEEVTFSYDLATHVLDISVENPAVPGTGQTLAHWVDRGTILWPTDLAGDDPTGSTYTLHHAADGGMAVVDGAVTGADGSITLSYDTAGPTDEQAATWPHLAGMSALSVDEADRAVFEEALRGQLLVTRTGDTVEAATGVQVPGVLDDLYADGARQTALGPVVEGGVPHLAIWAPTARTVTLQLFDDAAGTGEPTEVEMTRDEDGTWSAAGSADWLGRAYRYDVEVFVPSTGQVEHNVVTDPYSLALTTNSTHSVLLDLDDPALAPEVWTDSEAPVIEDFVDRSIYELHVRDFSISDETVPEELRGTYGAFALEGTDGVEHLEELADAGMNTIHLLPTFDIATIEEDRAEQVVPEIPDAGPASTEQQAAVSAVADQDAFNWGYDPLHYSVPEGSYASDGNQDGGDRVVEYREMVGGLHRSGYQVVLDQVFNHTAASGQSEQSVLDRVVPGYYHRLSLTGQVETSTCCQNIATEHAMAEQLMVDSVVTWAREYRVDGFRFDLMGHHSRENMEAVRAALDELTLEDDGVDGSEMYIYGEGWNFGEVTDNARFEQATQGQLDGTDIGAFNDRLRDAVHGGGPFDEDKRENQGFGTGLFTDPNGVSTATPEEQRADLLHRTDLVRLGMAGNLADYTFVTSTGSEQRGDELDYNGAPAGYASSPSESVNYVDAHDNETLYDLGIWRLPTDTSMADRVRMNTLSLATVALGQSPAFWHAGTDQLRSKSMDRDSYNSGDHFNAVDWSGQSNNFGVGLPPEEKNGAHWDLLTPLLENPALTPEPADIAAAHEQSLDLMRLRTSTELFRLGDADAIQEMVTFPNGGADATPGLLVMSVDDTTGRDVDPDLDRLVTVFNASPEPITEAVDGLAGVELALHEVQANGDDEVVRGTTWDAATGTVTIPARTVAVLVAEQDAEPPVEPAPTHGFFLDNGWDDSPDHIFRFGVPSAQVVVGDWDGDGTDTVGVRDNATFFLRNRHAAGSADVVLVYGHRGDEVLVGDWDGDGVDTFAVRRGNRFHLRNSLTSGPADVTLDYGRASDPVLVGDWDADGADTLGVRRGSRYFLDDSLAGGWASQEFTYGRDGDVVLVGDWDGDGHDTLAVRRGNRYLLRNSFTDGWADLDLTYGRADDEVLVGDWDGDGTDTLGVRRRPS